ncbi:MAG: hypothetical protein WC658_02110 [Candidatus Omnitrophota bacterium]
MGAIKLENGILLSFQVYLFDLYHGQTYNNLKKNSGASITAVDEHRFKGYCLKGRAKLMAGLSPALPRGLYAMFPGSPATQLIRRCFSPAQST